MSISPVGGLKAPSAQQSLQKLQQPPAATLSNRSESDPVVRNDPASPTPVTYNKSGTIDSASKPSELEGTSASVGAKEIIGNFPK